MSGPARPICRLCSTPWSHGNTRAPGGAGMARDVPSGLWQSHRAHTGTGASLTWLGATSRTARGAQSGIEAEGREMVPGPAESLRCKINPSM